MGNEMKIEQKRKVGAILGRDGITSRIVALAEDITNGSYKNAIEKAGQISVLVEAASFDDYWGEKSGRGKSREQEIFIELIEGNIPVDRVKKFVNPCLPSNGE